MSIWHTCCIQMWKLAWFAQALTANIYCINHIKAMKAISNSTCWHLTMKTNKRKWSRQVYPAVCLTNGSAACSCMACVYYFWTSHGCCWGNRWKCNNCIKVFCKLEHSKRTVSLRCPSNSAGRAMHRGFVWSGEVAQGSSLTYYPSLHLIPPPCHPVSYHLSTPSFQ